METRNIGSLDVPVIGLGCNNFGGRLDKEGTARVIDAAIDHGVVFFDTADIYGKTFSETFIGELLGPRRSKIVLATKFGHDLSPTQRGAHPTYIRSAIEDSLRRLQTDVIDLYQLHKPDPSVPLADTLGTLDDLVKEGKVREIGCSNFDCALLEEGEQVRKDARFVSVQNEYSIFRREDEAEVIPTCARLDVAYIPYFPLASGLLTGKYRRGQTHPEGTRIAADAKVMTEANLDRVERLITYAADHGRSLLDLAFAYLLSEPVVASVIAGATKPEQIAANAAAADWRLTPGQRAEVATLAEEADELPRASSYTPKQ